MIPHKCFFKCNICKIQLTPENCKEHKCFSSAFKDDTLDLFPNCNKFIYFDYETYLDENNRHQPNLIVAQYGDKRIHTCKDYKEVKALSEMRFPDNDEFNPMFIFAKSFVNG